MKEFVSHQDFASIIKFCWKIYSDIGGLMLSILSHCATCFVIQCQSNVYTEG